MNIVALKKSIEHPQYGALPVTKQPEEVLP